MKLFDEERVLELRREYQKSNLFCTLYPALAELERRYDELSPTQIWHEMEVFCAGHLLGSQALEMEVIAHWNTLLKRYSTFITPDGEECYIGNYYPENAGNGETVVFSSGNIFEEINNG